MRKKIDLNKKQFGVTILSLFFAIVICTSTVFAEAGNAGIIKTHEEIELEMINAFSEEFSRDFNEADFPDMIITYDEDGVPIVTDPNPSKLRAVYATTKYAKNGFYSSLTCDSSSLLFYIVGGVEVQVTDSMTGSSVVKVVYAGRTGYMKKAELKF